MSLMMVPQATAKSDWYWRHTMVRYSGTLAILGSGTRRMQALVTDLSPMTDMLW